MTNNKLLFSIIVPIYNIENYIEKCVESLINQTYKNLEIILVDDGSTDSSGKICDKYIEKDNRIKTIHKENGGLSSARNSGIEVAVGDYVLFVDGDDFLSKNAVEILVKTLIEYSCDILCFNAYQYKNENIIGNVITSKFDDIEESKKHAIINPAAWARAYKNSFLKKNHFYFKEGIIYEDLALIPGLSSYTENIRFIDDCLYYYVIRENSIMNITKFRENRDDKFIALQVLENIFKKNGSYEKYKNEIEYLYIKHLLIMYSTEILKYGKEIYMPRTQRALDTINGKFPNWFGNTYLKREPVQTKFYLWCFKYKLIFLLIFMNKVFMILKNKK